MRKFYQFFILFYPKVNFLHCSLRSSSFTNKSNISHSSSYRRRNSIVSLNSSISSIASVRDKIHNLLQKERSCSTFSTDDLLSIFPKTTVENKKSNEVENTTLENTGYKRILTPRKMDSNHQTTEENYGIIVNANHTESFSITNHRSSNCDIPTVDKGDRFATSEINKHHIVGLSEIYSTTANNKITFKEGKTRSGSMTTIENDGDDNGIGDNTQTYTVTTNNKSGKSSQLQTLLRNGKSPINYNNHYVTHRVFSKNGNTKVKEQSTTAESLSNNLLQQNKTVTSSTMNRCLWKSGQNSVNNKIVIVGVDKINKNNNNDKNSVNNNNYYSNNNFDNDKFIDNGQSDDREGNKKEESKNFNSRSHGGYYTFVDDGKLCYIFHSYFMFVCVIEQDYFSIFFTH